MKILKKAIRKERLKYQEAIKCIKKVAFNLFQGFYTDPKCEFKINESIAD